jgi:transcriptional regulator with XRE-family HTH domain
MTQAEFAEACGMSQQTISSWETGRAIPSMKSRRKLAEVLGKTPHEILAAIKATQAQKGGQKERPAA